MDLETKTTYPEYKRILWRGLRTAVAAGLTQALYLNLDWADPSTAYRVFGAAFIAGVFVSGAKLIRDELGSSDQDNLLHKMPI